MARGSDDPWGLAATVVGLAAIGSGGLVAARGAWDLRASLSPFPRPVAGAPLIESGAYRLIRHPIYSGLVLGAVGWGLVTGSILAIGATGLLFLLFAGKSSGGDLAGSGPPGISRLPAAHEAPHPVDLLATSTAEPQ